MSIGLLIKKYLFIYRTLVNIGPQNSIIWEDQKNFSALCADSVPQQ